MYTGNRNHHSGVCIYHKFALTLCCVWTPAKLERNRETFPNSPKPFWWPEVFSTKCRPKYRRTPGHHCRVGMVAVPPILRHLNRVWAVIADGPPTPPDMQVRIRRFLLCCLPDGSQGRPELFERKKPQFRQPFVGHRNSRRWVLKRHRYSSCD